MKSISKQLALLFIVMIGVSACRDRLDPKPEYLLKLDDVIITETEYNQAVEMAKIAYPSDIMQKEALLKELRVQVLDQLIERMVLLRRAKDIGIEVSDAELEKAVHSIKGDYPEGEFEQTLIASSISLDNWKRELKTHLIIEKLVAKDLTSRIEITPQDIAKYYNEEFQKQSGNPQEPNVSKDLYELIISNLRRKKAELAYPLWLKELKQRYPVDVNQELFERICRS